MNFAHETVTHMCTELNLYFFLIDATCRLTTRVAAASQQMTIVGNSQ